MEARHDVAGLRVLASEVLGEEELDALIDQVCGGVAKKKVGVAGLLGTGVRSLDEVFEGGLERGKVVGIGSEAGAGGTELCQALIVEALVKDGDAVTAVVDTTGNFDILKLYTRILSRLQRDPETTERLRSSIGLPDPETKIDDVAAKVLDRVKIMRVFDFVGVREAVGEIRDELEGKEAVVIEKKEGEQNVNRDDIVVDNPPAVEAPPKRTYVADSEDEEDEEMLFDAETTTEPAPPTPKADSSIQDQTASAKEDSLQEDQPQIRNKTTLILIDNLAQVLTPVLKNDYIEANALASTFLHHLTILTRTYALHTLLLNPTTTLRAPSPTRQGPQHPNQPPPHQQHQAPLPSPSIFASSTALPSLANLLGRHVDVGLLVTRVPRKKMDARVFYIEEAESKGGRKRGVEMVGVLEVVSDRWEGRVGNWGMFVVGDDGTKELSR